MTYPGVLRGVLGLILGIIIGAALISVIRLVMGYEFASGPTVFFSGFGGLLGWLWGVGTFNPQSHEHNGIEHLIEKGEPSGVQVTMGKVRQATPNVFAFIKPLIQPLLIALTIAVAVIAVFMLLGTVLPIHRIQTDKVDAAATAITSNKLVIFAIVVLVIFALLGGLAIGLAALMNALSRNVEDAKKAPATPPTESNVILRLIDFFVTWLYDIFAGTSHSLNR